MQSNDIADHLITDVLGERREYQGSDVRQKLFIPHDETLLSEVTRFETALAFIPVV